MKECHRILTERDFNTVFSQEKAKLILFKGSSMNSTLQDMDVLFYVPDKRIRPGDVVVINIPELEHRIIHRVISIGEKGIRTMGDSNPYPDGWFLSPDQIIGSVAYGYRGGQRFRVPGGSAGLVQMLKVQIKHLTIRAAYPILSIIYRNFPISSLMMLLIRPRSVAFKRPGGIELHLLARGKVIGRRLPGQRWQIKSPYRFFLDESSLPE